MPLDQTIAVTILALIMLSGVLGLIRSHLMSEKYSVIWILVSLGLLTVPWLHGTYVRIAGLIGIKDPQSFFFFFSILGLAALNLQFTVAISSAFQDRKTLVQELALLRERVRTLESTAGNAAHSSDAICPKK